MLVTVDYGSNVKQQEWVVDKEVRDQIFEQLSLGLKMLKASSALRRSEEKKTEHFKVLEGATQPLFWAKFGLVVSMSIVRSHKYISAGVQGHKHTCTDANTLCCYTTHINTHIQAHKHTSSHTRKKIGASVFSMMSSLSAASASCYVDYKL